MDIQRLTLTCVRVGVVVACMALFGRDALPVHALTFTVNVTGDQADLTNGTGACDVDAAAGNQCTLRAALQSAAINAGMDTINFDIGFGAKTITIGSGLPIINGPILIDGLTQQAGNMSFHVDCYLTLQHPCIEINGNGVNADGLVVSGGPATIRGLVINRFLGNGIRIYNSSSNNVIQYNYIGTNMDGTADLGNGNNFDEGGIRVSGAGNTIGGTTGFLPAFPTLPTANLISGNHNYGVILENGSTTGNTVLGNYIGTNRAGTAAIPNAGGGVKIDNSAFANTIGGTVGTTPSGSCTGACNVISGNGGSGIEILDGATANAVMGNFIGTDPTGTVSVANSDTGIFIGRAPANMIGGTTAAARNLISGNNGDGIQFFGDDADGNNVAGNFIGTNTSGAGALYNNGSGIVIEDSDNSVIGGTAGTSPGVSCTGACNLIAGFDDFGVFLFADDPESVTGSMVQGNFIGTNATGTVTFPSQIVGVFMATSNGGTVAGNIVGGTTPATRNLIAVDEGTGVQLEGPGTANNVVQGNFLGTTANGAVALTQRYGAQILDGAHDNTIGGSAGTTPGGPCTGACNVISGHEITGVYVAGPPGTSGNVIAGNHIGTDPQGLGVNPNGAGIFLFGVSGNTVGGDSVAERNIISGNSGDGIYIVADEAGQGDADENVVANNYIGIRSDGEGDLGNGRYGVLILGSEPTYTANGNILEDNVISGNNSDGVRISSDNPGAHAEGNTIRRNLIGLNAAGDAEVPNSANGVTLESTNGGSVRSNVIGGVGPPPNRAGLGGDGNVISGHPGNGVDIQGTEADNNGVYGNLIGTLADGESAAGNSFFGVRISAGASENQIGWEDGGNVIAASTVGIRIGDAATTDNSIVGNYIGTNAGGSEGLGNAAEGIYVSNSPNNTIGGFSPGQGNVVRNNGAAGVRIQDADAVENRITGNSIDDNATLGIQLDAGGNEDQAAPVLKAAENGSTHIEGTLESAPNTEYRLEFFSSPECDPGGSGEGRVYLGAANVTTNAGGTTAIDVTIPATAAAGDVLTATAQDAMGNTSEFSNCVVVTGSATPTPSPTSTASPTPTATPSPTGANPTPTGTGPAPTGDGTPTPTPTPTATPGPGELIQGDVQCDGDVDSVDALQQLRKVAGLPTFQEDGCPGIGAAGGPFGDVDCDGDVDSVDALKVLRHVAALSVTQDEPCTDIGEPL